MSAAHAIPGAPPGPAETPASAPPAPPRRLTGKRLHAALLRDPRFKDAVRMHDVVPIGGKEVLLAICELVAEQVGTWRWEPAPAMRGRVVPVVALRMGTVGGDAAIEELLQALVAAGLVVRDAAGGLTVPADFGALTLPVGKAAPALRETPPGFVDRGGRPRRGEDPAQRQLRLLAEVGGKPPTETPPETGEVSGRFSGNLVSPVSPQNPETRFSLVHSDSAAAAEEQVTDSSLVQQQQQLGESAREETETGVSGNLGVFGEVSGFAAGLLGPEQAAVQAQVLAVQVGEILGVDGSRGTPGAALCAEWLALPGMTAGAVLEVARARRDANDRKVAAKGGVPIGTFDFLDAAVRDRAGVPPKPRAALPAADTARSLPPELERPWLQPGDRHMLLTALGLLEAGKTEALGGCLKRMAASHARALKLLADTRPELARAVGVLTGG